MTAITRKLKSKSGISLAIALVFFLLCAMVGTVALSAASVSAGNTARERQLYRETLAMTSAADVLKGEIQAMTVQSAYTKTETVTTNVLNGKTSVTTSVSNDKGETSLKNSPLFEGRLNLSTLFTVPQNAMEPQTPAPVEKNLTFKGDETRNLPAVAVKLTVEPDHTLTATLECGENSLTMVFPPLSNQSVEVSAPAVNTSGPVSTRKTVTTYTTTLTWDSPAVREGGGA